MNMEDLLMSIWTATGSQAVGSSTGGVDGSVPGGSLQRQGFLTLPRTLSQKTVGVWRDVLKETVGGKPGNGCVDSNMGPRQPTLGEMTLEEFPSLTGVVREDTQPCRRLNGTGVYSGLPPSTDNNSTSNIGFQRPSRNHGLLGNQLVEQNNIVLSSPNVGINTSDVTSAQQQPQLQLQPLFPKQTTLAFSSRTQLGSKSQLASPVTKGPVVEMKNALCKTQVQGGATVMGGLTVAGGSPGNNFYVGAIGKNDTGMSTLLPSPYNFGECGRSRRSSASLEKVVERRQRRMIKNRESAARSRARKQAYTLELEAELAMLKELNQELREKQKEFMEKQKNESYIYCQILETIKPVGGKRRCLRRTLTGPW